MNEILHVIKGGKFATVRVNKMKEKKVITITIHKKKNN